MKKIFLLFFINCSLSIIYGQKITIDNLILSAQTDDRVVSNQNAVYFANSLHYNMPFFKKVEARFGVNGNLTADTLDGNFRNEDYYALSVVTNNWKEMRLQKAVKPAQINVFTTEKQVILHQVLLERYQSVLSCFYASQLLEERSGLLKLLENKAEILRKSIEQGIDIRFKDVMDTENDKNLLSSLLLDYENTLAINQAKIQQFLKTKEPVILDYQEFIGAESIAQNVRLIQKDSGFLHPILEYRHAQVSYSAAEFALEKIQNRQILSFVQLGATRPTYEVFPLSKFKVMNNLALRIGLTVPIPSNNNFKVSKTAMQLKDDEQTEWVARQMQAKMIDIQAVKINNVLKSYYLNEKNVKESLIVKLLNNPKLTGILTPVELIDLQIAQRKLQIRSTEIRSDLSNEYLRFLEMTGAFAKFSNRNFLKN